LGPGPLDPRASYLPSKKLLGLLPPQHERIADAGSVIVEEVGYLTLDEGRYLNVLSPY
jgi:hypothetical protein